MRTSWSRSSKPLAVSAVWLLVALSQACGGEGESDGSGAASGAGSGGASAAGGGGSGNAGSGGASAGTSGAGASTVGALESDVAARAGAVIGSCHPDNGVNRETAKLWQRKYETGSRINFGAQAECIAAQGGGCDALEECVGWTVEVTPGCADGVACTGSIFTLCTESVGLRYTIDCATMGLDCNPDETIDNIAEAGAACRSGEAVSCDQATFAPSCDGSVLSYCDAAEVREADCAEEGAGCSDGVCTGTGAPCTVSPSDPTEGVSCNGNVLESCQNGRSAALDCTSYGAEFGCRTIGDVSFCGLATDCVPGELPFGPQDGDPPPACDGTAIVFCNAGRLEHLDCTSLGFSGCDVDAGWGCVPTPFSEF